MREHEHEHEQLADLEGADGVEVLLEAVEDALEPISHHETFSKTTQPPYSSTKS